MLEFFVHSQTNPLASSRCGKIMLKFSASVSGYCFVSANRYRAMVPFIDKSSAHSCSFNRIEAAAQKLNKPPICLRGYPERLSYLPTVTVIPLGIYYFGLEIIDKMIMLLKINRFLFFICVQGQRLLIN